MKKILTYLFVLFCGCIVHFVHLSAVIVPCPDLDLFEKAVAEANEHTLVMFDVDDTLIIPEDRVLRGTAHKLSDKFIQEILKNPEIVPPNKYPKDFLHSKTCLKVNFIHVNAKALDIIHSLQQKNIKTIAFTKMHSGPMGLIPSLADWRVEHLKKLHYDFTKAFPDIASMHVEENEINGFFKSGVLFSQKKDKGPVLRAFLKQIPWAPKKVMFLDDRQDYLQTVEDALKDTGIEFIGYHYTFAKDHAEPVDEALAHFQYMHLALHGEWLNETEALELMRLKI